MTPQNPAAGAPRPGRAARATVPGGPATSPAPTGVAGGKTPQADSPAPPPEVTPGPETRRPGNASVRAGDQAPAGSATDPGEAASAVPAGSIPSTEPGEGARGGGQEPGRGGGTLRPGQGARPALRGAEWRAAAAKASRRRPAKSTPRTAAKAPAILPPPVPGASLTATATCLAGCEWTATGDPGEVDKAAAGHTKAGHATNLFSEPRSAA